MEIVAGLGRRKTMAFERLLNASCLGFSYINILTLLASCLCSFDIVISNSVPAHLCLSRLLLAETVDRLTGLVDGLGKRFSIYQTPYSRAW
jgi:hypothetical protein